MGKIRVLGTWRTPTERAGGRVSDGVAKYPGERVNARDHGVVSAGPGGLRVVIALGQEYNVYGEAFASAILSYRPRAVVEHVPPEELDGAVARLEPLLVITDSVGDAADASVLARAEISAEPAEPSRFVVGGQVREVLNPSLGDLLALVDDTERTIGGGDGGRSIRRREEVPDVQENLLGTGDDPGGGPSES